MNADSNKEECPSGIPLPRGLILLTCLWIAGSWVENIGLRTPIQPVAEDYSYGLRMLCASMVIGIVLAWPMLRLCVANFMKPVRQTLLDLAVVISGILITIWPLRLLSSWSVEQTILISGLMVNWAILSGAIVCYGTSTRSGIVRALLILVLFGVIGIGTLLPDPEDVAWWRPLDLILQVSLPDHAAPQGHELQLGGILLGQSLVAAAGTWLLALGARGCQLRSGRPQTKRVPSTE